MDNEGKKNKTKQKVRCTFDTVTHSVYDVKILLHTVLFTSNFCVLKNVFVILIICTNKMCHILQHKK